MIRYERQQAVLEVCEPIVVGNQPEHPVVASIHHALHDQLTVQETSQVFPTLGLLKSPAVHWLTNKDEKELIEAIASLEKGAVVYVDTLVGVEKRSAFLEKLAKGIVVKNYVFDELKSIKKTVEKHFVLVSEASDGATRVSEGEVVGQAINKTRRFVDLPYNYLNAEKLAVEAEKMGSQWPELQVTIQDKAAIEALKMGAFLGVNRGSKDEPRLIEIRYQGKSTWENPLCLIGKGVMFDTGGYSLKSNMVNMKSDMAGAAAVLGALQAIASLKLPVNVMGVVLATDNRVDGGSTVPDDVLVAMNGKTIEIVSIDAEGRLTLADALWYAQEQGASRIVDVATLTGSIVASLGSYYTGVFANHEGFYEQITKASKQAEEPLWRMPLDDQYFKGLKSEVADFKNSGPRVAGASVAAIFLKQFVKDQTQWIHLDIAGTSTDSSGCGTGVMVGTFVELAKCAE